jgi:hypothetical protein
MEQVITHAGQDLQIMSVLPDGSLHIEMIVVDDTGIEHLEEV